VIELEPDISHGQQDMYLQMVL